MTNEGKKRALILRVSEILIVIEFVWNFSPLDHKKTVEDETPRMDQSDC